MILSGKNYVVEVRVRNVEPFGDIKLNLSGKGERAPGLVVVVGPPGSGKALLLSMIEGALAGPRGIHHVGIFKCLRWQYRSTRERGDVISEVTLACGHRLAARWTPARRVRGEYPLIQETPVGGTRRVVRTGRGWPLELQKYVSWTKDTGVSEWFRESNFPEHIELLDTEEIVDRGPIPLNSSLKNITYLSTNAEEIVLLGNPEEGLHPLQRRGLGGWLKEKFPKAQFFISTNDPLLCQDADCIIKLPGVGEDGRKAEGSKVQVFLPGDPMHHQVTGGTPNDTLFSLFDLPSVYSPRTDKLLDNLASLEGKVIDGKASDAEREEVMKTVRYLLLFSCLLPRLSAMSACLRRHSGELTLTRTEVLGGAFDVMGAIKRSASLMYQGGNQQRETVEQSLKVVFPELVAVEIKGSRSFKELDLTMVGGQRVPSGMISEGWSVACLVFSVMHCKDNTGSLLILDCWADHLGAELQPSFVREVKRVAECRKVQTILTTRCPYVLDGAEPSEVWILHDGRATPLLSFPDANKSLEILSLGEFYSSAPWKRNSSRSSVG